MAGHGSKRSDASLAGAVADAIGELELNPADSGAVRLARHYAESIDSADARAEALEKLGPKLLAVLESLGATPRARAVVAKGGGSGDGRARSSLDELRRARERRAASVDSSAT